jgi:hypothetical protein
MTELAHPVPSQEQDVTASEKKQGMLRRFASAIGNSVVVGGEESIGIRHDSAGNVTNSRGQRSEPLPEQVQNHEIPER